LRFYNNQWLALRVKSVLPLKSWSVDWREFGSIPTNLNKSDKPTQEYSSESSSRMVLSWKESKKSTPDQEPDSICKPRDSVDTAVQVKREVPGKQECQPKSFGLEDKESSEDFWESIELLKKSIELSTTSFTLLPRVTNSRTKQSWWKPFSSKKPKRSIQKSSKPNKTPEDKRISKEEKEELKRLKDSDWLYDYLNI